MISRIIEARPDDLRDFLEEAAGISKYKERRRETEIRMRHTLENLERLDDLREELARQAGPSPSARRPWPRSFESSRRLSASSKPSTLRSNGAPSTSRPSRNDGRIAAQQSRLDAALAGQRRTEAELEKARAAHTEAVDAYNRRYRSVIDAGAEVARTEEFIQSIRRRREEITGTLREEGERLDAARRQIEGERRQRDELAARLAREEPTLAELHEQSSGAHRELSRIEDDVHALQAEFEALSRRERDPARTVHAEQARIQHLESSIEALESRARGLEAERGEIDLDAREREAAPARERLEAMERELEAEEAEQSRARNAVRDLRASVQAAEKSLHHVREALGQHRGRLASLDALQREALGTGDGRTCRLAGRQGSRGCFPACAGDASRTGLGARGGDSARCAPPGGAGRCVRDGRDRRCGHARARDAHGHRRRRSRIGRRSRCARPRAAAVRRSRPTGRLRGWSMVCSARPVWKKRSGLASSSHRAKASLSRRECGSAPHGCMFGGVARKNTAYSNGNGHWKRWCARSNARARRRASARARPARLRRSFAAPRKRTPRPSAT